ncbi:hypothetical protein MUK42_08399, partial [Musa troglodytarum]
RQTHFLRLVSLLGGTYSYPARGSQYDKCRSPLRPKRFGDSRKTLITSNSSSHERHHGVAVLVEEPGSAAPSSVGSEGRLREEARGGGPGGPRDARGGGGAEACGRHGFRVRLGGGFRR